jgi:hypothetical protein
MLPQIDATTFLYYLFHIIKNTFLLLKVKNPISYLKNSGSMIEIKQNSLDLESTGNN